MLRKALVGAILGVLSWSGTAHAQALPAGPKVTVSAVTQAAPTIPPYTRVDIPLLREGAVKASGGRVEFNLKIWPEMNLQGPEVIRLMAPCSTSSRACVARRARLPSIPGPASRS